MYDLPSEDPEEPGLPDHFHIYQPRLLDERFQSPNYPVDGDSRFYEERNLRLSYVIWQEGIVPFIVVELISPGTEKEDLG